MPDGVDDRGCRARDGSEVMREGEDRPVRVDRTELGVLSIVEYAIVDELRADDDVLTGLPGGALALWSYVGIEAVPSESRQSTYV